MVYFGENFVEVNSVKVVCEIRIMMYTPLKFQARDEVLGLPGGAVVKGAVLQRQLCHQRPWVRAQALS